MIGSELPKGWKEVKLSDLAEIQSGGTPSRSNTAYWNGNIPNILRPFALRLDLTAHRGERYSFQTHQWNNKTA